LKKLFVPALIFVAVVVIGILAWQVLSQRRAVTFVADKPSLAVMHFENNTGDESLDHWRKALSDLLIADLSQSRYIAVLSSEELYNILEEKNLLDVKSYSSRALEEVASRAGVQYVQVGKMMMAGDTIRIDTTIQEARTGKVVGSERVEGQGEDSFFTMVDELTRKVKTNFKLTDEQIAGDIDREAGTITTTSPEAYKYYREGVKFFLKGDYPNSIAMLEMSVGIDPEFAMAYRQMASAYENLGYGAEASESLKSAFDLRDRVSDRERYYIQGLFYGRAEETYTEAIAAYNELLELYPEDEIGNTNLGWLYLTLEQWDKSLGYFEILRKNRDEAIQTYEALATIYMAKGQYDRAVDVLEEFMENFSENASIREFLAQVYITQGKYTLAQNEADKIFLVAPTHFRNFSIRGDLHFYQGNLDGAQSEYQKLFETEEPIAHNAGLRKLAAHYVMQGMYDEALEQLEQGVELGDMLGETNWKAWFYLNMAYVHLRLNDFDKALETCKNSENIARDSGDADLLRRALHMRGVIQLEREGTEEARKTAMELQSVIEHGMQKKAIRYYHNLFGLIKLKERNFSGAVEDLMEANSILPAEYDEDHGQAFFLYSLAKAYSEAGNADAAHQEFEEILSLTTGRFYYGDLYVSSKEQLESSGKTDS
jgi:tetratricopeptide (TPR) repeat protein